MNKLADPYLDQDTGVDLRDPESMKRRIIHFMRQLVGKHPRFANPRDWFHALAYFVRGELSERYIRTAQVQQEHDVKRVYYLSMEYLLGRSLVKNLIDLDLLTPVKMALDDFGVELQAVEDVEFDAALGNGGLGRLAACFLDTIATHGYPGFAYGIHYQYGLFAQQIKNGQQVEQPEPWLRYGNPWTFERPDIIYRVQFGGRVLRYKGADGRERHRWVDGEETIAMACDYPVSGFGGKTVTNLRLWVARASHDFDLHYFNEGNFVEAVKDKTTSETLSKVLYPADTTLMGQELRLRQEYFFVSASLQDILVRYRRNHERFDELPSKVAIHLNDTHPSLAIPELMRLLVDDYDYLWEDAWKITLKTFAYTNHTLLPEALETWPAATLGRLLPRHLEIVYGINHRFLQHVRRCYPGDIGVLRRLSLQDDDHGRIRMSHLAIVGSHKVNGVAELHSSLMRSAVFTDFHRLYPDRIINVTNGVTPRRWLLQANPNLSSLISERIGEGWITDLSKLKGLEPFATDPEFVERFLTIRRANKTRLANLIKDRLGVVVDPTTMFDVMVKRIHEYKRQLLDVLHVVTRYLRLRESTDIASIAPRTIMFGGKAAPSYFMAKLIIRLINDVAERVNSDPAINGRLKVCFIPDYNVSAAELIIPGTDLSEHISTAGTEASGTGIMKFELNGALTICTFDGVNIEIRQEVGQDNIFIFGRTAEENRALRSRGYDPWQYYRADPTLKEVLDMIGNGFFSPGEPGRYRPIIDALLHGGDHYMVLADYGSYIACQEKVDTEFQQSASWAKRAIVNIANMGQFSSDRAVHTYARDIWNIEPEVF